MTTVLKLGGSVITRKDEPETVDHQRLTRAAAAVAEYVCPVTAEGSATDEQSPALVLVHGGGSFGHHHADRHGVSPVAGTRDVGAIRAIHGAMVRLNGIVLDTLAEHDVPALPVQPLSVGYRDGASEFHVPVAHVSTMLGEGFVPTLHGDLIAHSGHGTTVVSGDELVVAVAEALGADRVGLCTSTPGVYDVDGSVIERIESYDDVAEALEDGNPSDVTGGMAGKVRALLGLDMPAAVFDLEGLGAFLDGGRPGTRIE